VEWRVAVLQLARQGKARQGREDNPILDAIATHDAIVDRLSQGLSHTMLLREIFTRGNCESWLSLSDDVRIILMCKILVSKGLWFFFDTKERLSVKVSREAEVLQVETMKPQLGGFSAYSALECA
jgi:hypothetical protein